MGKNNWAVKWTDRSKKDWAVSGLFYLFAVIFMPFGVVLTINANLGAGGCDALNFALADKLKISTSLAIYITAGLALIAAAVIRKGFPKISTFLTSFFLGLSTDFWKQVLAGLQGTGITGRIVLFTAGLLVIGLAVASYIRSGLPTNPTDDLVVALKEKGCSIRFAKIALDTVCVISAFLLGGKIGAGTIICTFCLGPVIDFFHGILGKIDSRTHAGKGI